MIIVAVDRTGVRLFVDGREITSDVVEAVHSARACWRQLRQTLTSGPPYATPTKPPVPNPPPQKEST